MWLFQCGYSPAVPKPKKKKAGSVAGDTTSAAHGQVQGGGAAADSLPVCLFDSRLEFRCPNSRLHSGGGGGGGGGDTVEATAAAETEGMENETAATTAAVADEKGDTAAAGGGGGEGGGGGGEGGGRGEGSEEGRKTGWATLIVGEMDFTFTADMSRLVLSLFALNCLPSTVCPETNGEDVDAAGRCEVAVEL